ncbi:MAG: thioredoxin domain-containing protein [Patescibacteria group bacterium]
MKRSPLFLGLLTLCAVLLLMVYGIAAVAPLFETSTDEVAIVAPKPTQPKIDFGNPSLGPTDAALTIVVFGNYQCPSCGAFDQTVLDLLAEHPDDIRLVWKDTPNTSSYPESRSAAIAARCAGEQGAFWEYHGTLMENQAAIDAANFPIFALELGLDTDAFATCLAERRPDHLIQRDIDEAIALGVNATPYVFVGDKPLSGALSKEQLSIMISTILTGLSTP